MTGSNTGARNLDWLISVDDHILEPPNVWVDRVPAKDRDRAPHMETDDNGLECWVYGGNRYQAPNRIWTYDTAFNSVLNLPPFTPMAVSADDIVTW